MTCIHCGQQARYHHPAPRCTHHWVDWWFEDMEAACVTVMEQTQMARFKRETLTRLLEEDASHDSLEELDQECHEITARARRS